MLAKQLSRVPNRYPKVLGSSWIVLADPGHRFSKVGPSLWR
jgi:hypothetical protein